MLQKTNGRTIITCMTMSQRSSQKSLTYYFPSTTADLLSLVIVWEVMVLYHFTLRTLENINRFQHFHLFVILLNANGVRRLSKDILAVSKLENLMILQS